MARGIDQIDLFVRHVNAVSEQSLLGHDPCAGQPIDNRAAEAPLAVVLVDISLGHVDVDAHPRPSCCVDAAGERLVGQGERGVSSNHPPSEGPGMAQEPFVLLDSGERTLFAVAIGDFVAEHGAPTDLVERIRDDLQRTLDGVG